jgi:peroxiredoxin
MIHTLVRLFRITALVLVLLCNTSILFAVAFPFREFEPGDPVPDVTLFGRGDARETVSFSDLQGRPFVAVFWGADIEEKLERSARTLEGLESLSSFLEKRGIPVISVNIQGDPDPVVAQVLEQSQSSADVYLDRDRKAYGRLGIFIMPTILLVDREGVVAAGMGYSRDVIDRLRGEIEIMLGEKTREQVLAELRPEMKELSEEEKAGSRHMQYALVMRDRGMLDAAVRELEKAVAILPGLTEARFELACLYLQQGELEKAEKVFAGAVENRPQTLRTRLCEARFKRARGRAAEAVDDLQSVLREHPEAHEGLYILGRAYEDLGRMREATTAYRRAYLSIRNYAASGEKE